MSYEYLRAKQNLDNFLKQNPELISYQRKLESALNSAGDDVSKRFEIFNRFLHDNLLQLTVELKLLDIKVKELKEKL